MSTLYVDNLQPNLGSQVEIPQLKPLAGSIVQVKQTVLTTRASYSGTSFFTIDGLTTTITPTNANNKILAMVCICQGENQDAFPAYLLKRNGTVLGLNTDGPSTRATFGSVNTANSYRDVYLIQMVNYQYLDSPNSTSPVTYTVEVSPMRTVSRTFYLNSSENQGDANQYSASSTMTLMEIAQ
jgi:hypothetical protein